MKEISPQQIPYYLKKSNISSALATQFTEFLLQNPLIEEQAIYLINEKNKKIQEVIEELYGVSIKQQKNWKQETQFDGLKIVENVLGQLEETKEWEFKKDEKFHKYKNKQELVKSITIRTNIHYLVIRIEPFISSSSQDKPQQNFRWSFFQATWKKYKWVKEKPLAKNAKELIRNPALSQSFLDYLQKQPFIQEKNPDNSENTWILDSKETHYLISLLGNYPAIYFDKAKESLKQQNTPLDWHLSYKKTDNHYLVFTVFSYNGEDLDVEQERKEIYFLTGIQPAIIYKGKYWMLKNVNLPAVMMQEIIRGISVPIQEWEVFLKELKTQYSLKMQPTEKNFLQQPNEIISWFFWLKLQQKEQLPVFKKNMHPPCFYFLLDFTQHHSNNIGFKIENIESLTASLENSDQCPSVLELFNFAKKIAKKKN